MTSKLRRQMFHLRDLLQLKKNWKYYIEDTSGIYLNKVNFHFSHGSMLFTYDSLLKHIERTKYNINKERSIK